MFIIARPSASLEQCRTWIKNVKTAHKLAVENIEILYTSAEKNGIDPVVLIAQCMLETGYFKFGGVLDASYHNTCGLKTTKGGSDKAASAHMKFSSWEEGIQAHADHLALYAGATNFPKYSPNCAQDLNKEYKYNGTTQDPRHFSYLHGTCRTVESLEGKWATSPGYARKILLIVREIHNTKVSNNSNVVEKDDVKYTNGTYNKKAKITARALNVRRGRPGSKEYNSIMGSYKKGTVVTVKYCLNNWFGVIYNGKQGFICGDYVELID